MKMLLLSVKHTLKVARTGNGMPCHALNRAKDECMYPMKLDTLKTGYPDMYKEILFNV